MPDAPPGWDGLIIPGWMPDRFVNVSGTSMHYNGNLVCWDECGDETAVISFWDAAASPLIDTEDMAQVCSLEVQGIPATLFLKENNTLFLTSVKDDTVI